MNDDVIHHFGRSFGQGAVEIKISARRTAAPERALVLQKNAPRRDAHDPAPMPHPGREKLPHRVAAMQELGLDRRLDAVNSRGEELGQFAAQTAQEIAHIPHQGQGFGTLHSNQNMI